MSSSDEYTENLHKGAKASTFENARQLRRTETEAEKKLWLYLRNRQLMGKKNSGGNKQSILMYFIFTVMNPSWLLNWMELYIIMK